VLEAENGKVVLPLRPDLSDRPRQVVCDEYGRYAETDWQLVEHYQTTTRVYFYPKTGRSHQLRMHAAHQDGLNMPIVGDELYGYSAERLYLHADLLGFIHPKSGQYVEFFTNAVF
jgi:tRNA pseudouridine32 synthase/23S rRNA pseudouridine746 synthase